MLADRQRALEQIIFARGYTRQLLLGIRPADWFAMPGGVTHLAWQVGHLAMAQYLLSMVLVRGARPEDALLIDEGFIKSFARQSVPSPDPASYPTPEVILKVFDAVHVRVLVEVPAVDEATLALPPLRDHSRAQTRLASLMWCGQHEMLHAGQIGLLRRLLGYASRY